MKLHGGPQPAWVARMWERLTPLKDKVVDHAYFKEMGEGTLDIERFQRLLIDWYPLVEAFPMYLSMNLSKLVRYTGPGREELRRWLILNIKIELEHAMWWRDWAHGFGIDEEQMALSTACPEVQAVQDHIELMSDRGTVYEALGAANIAMEWPTSEWTRDVVKGVRAYGGLGLARIDDKTMQWLTSHAHYDDVHPLEAMALIRKTTSNEREREAAFQAASRGLELFSRALTATYMSGVPVS